MVWFDVWPRVSGLGYDARFGRVGYRRRVGIGVTSEGEMIARGVMGVVGDRVWRFGNVVD